MPCMKSRPRRPATARRRWVSLLALAARFAAASPRSSTALLVSEDFCARETGALYGPGLTAHGLRLGQLVFARAPDAPALLWTMEEALKSGALAVVVGEMWSLSRHYSLAASRRLLLAARAGRAPALLVHGGAFGRADAISSAAETRFEIAAASSRRLEPAGGRLGLPGAPAFAARLLKARLRPSAQGPPARGLDEARMVRLEWNGVERCFRDPTISLPLVRASVDGPGASACAGLKRASPKKPRRSPRPPKSRARRSSSASIALAADLGLAPGLPLADARARRPNLIAIEAAPEEEARLLARLADWCSRFTPLVALDGADGLMLDIAGVAHLFGGEEKMADEIETRLAAQGLGVALGIADTPRAAWALARFSDRRIAPTRPGGQAFRQNLSWPAAGRARA